MILTLLWTSCSVGMATHETMHALGLFHTQAYPNRDAFVQIHWDNIKGMTPSGVVGTEQYEMIPFDTFKDPKQAEVAAMASEAGEALTFDALVGCIQTAMQKTPSQDELLEALTAFDHTGSGTIRVEDLRKVLTEMAEDKLTPDQVEDLIRDGDKYRTGEVSFEFFSRMVSQF